MTSNKKCIFLNAGTETRKSFLMGIPDIPYEWYHTKNMILHIGPDMVPHFIYRNKIVDFTHSFVFTRLRSDDQQFCGILYDYFRHYHIPANDPINHSYENSAEKISQMLLLALHGLRVPPSIILREEGYRKNRDYIFKNSTFPLIFKTDGSRGRNVILIKDEAELDRAIQEKCPTRRALIQPFISNTFDTRTLVAFGTVLGSIKRTRSGGYLNNIAQGAAASVYELTPEERRAAKKAASVTGIDVAGVDMIHTEHEPIILEVNKSPQIQGYESAHKTSVFAEVASLYMCALDEGGVD